MIRYTSRRLSACFNSGAAIVAALLLTGCGNQTRLTHDELNRACDKSLTSVKQQKQIGKLFKKNGLVESRDGTKLFAVAYPDDIKFSVENVVNSHDGKSITVQIAYSSNNPSAARALSQSQRELTGVDRVWEPNRIVVPGDNRWAKKLKKGDVEKGSVPAYVQNWAEVQWLKLGEKGSVQNGTKIVRSFHLFLFVTHVVAANIACSDSCRI